jgi:hypothetical protein
MTSRNPPLVFYTHKPKAKKLAKVLQAGARRAGFDMQVTDCFVPKPNAIGIFYGVTHETYSCFRFYMAEGRAIYLDNGWLSTPGKPTFRFSWNSAQAFLQNMPPVWNWKRLTDPLPAINRDPNENTALLILQSAQYFEFMRLGYTRDTWEKVTTRILEGKGYTVERREKPTSKDQKVENFFDQIARAGVVVSLNSASTVKALRYGIPAFCLLDCTPSPLAPMRIPDAGRAAPPDQQAVAEMCARLMAYEVSEAQMRDGEAIKRMMAVPTAHRKGYWYGN